MLVIVKIDEKFKAKVGQCKNKRSEVSKLFEPHMHGSIVLLKLCRN